MNQLSWLIYWAEVSGRISFATGGIAFFTGMAAVITGGAALIMTALSHSLDEDERPPAALISSVKRAALSLLAGCALFTALSWFAPSKDTLMLVAASQVGETVLASKEVQAAGGEAGALAADSLKLLRKYVTEQLAGADAK